jgi:lipoyl(octanoyl) transferase
MTPVSATSPPTEAADPVLQIYLLGSVEFEAMQAFQRRLVYQASGSRHLAALVLCEHPPVITVGRHGSAAHILYEPAELRARQWPVRWINRGGGCLLHLPGQLALYSVIALDHFRLGLEPYLERLQSVLVASLQDFQIAAETRAGQAGVWVGNRPIAGVGVAVRDWVAYYGAVLNINPPLEPFRWVRNGRREDGPMTSLARERRGPLRTSLVRERLVEHFVAAFGVRRTSLFTDHPALSRKAPSDAVATRP